MNEANGDIWLAESVEGTVTRWALPSFEAVPQSPPPTAEALENIEAAAYQEGFERGHHDGYEVGQKSAITQGERLRALVDHMVRPLVSLDEEVERLLVELSATIARRLLLDELSAKPEHIVALVREALAALPPQLRRLRVSANPDDARLLRAHLVPPPQFESIDILDDADLKAGDCRVMTESSLVDARLERRVRAVAQVLLGESA